MLNNSGVRGRHPNFKEWLNGATATICMFQECISVGRCQCKKINLKIQIYVHVSDTRIKLHCRNVIYYTVCVHDYIFRKCIYTCGRIHLVSSSVCYRVIA
jgi:hypothetical protein